jgi:anti-sigma factor RsiW
MRHPNQATLALHAGGDLGKFARWKLERHLAKCEACSSDVAAYESTRELVAGLDEIPEIPWNHLAAEIKANIRLGLAAGECVRAESSPRSLPWFSAGRAVVACASIVALVAAGILLQGPKPAPFTAQAQPMVEATDSGIQLSSGGSAVGLMNRGVKAENVSYLPNAQGGISASYIDPSTGRLTVNTVYGQ